MPLPKSTSLSTSVSSSSLTVPATSAGGATASTNSWKLDAAFFESAQAAFEQKAVEDAVYAHLRAVRRLGRMSVTIAEVASALGLTPEVVSAAVDKLGAKGVKQTA
jgi:ribosomal protein L20A (L18A)